MFHSTREDRRGWSIVTFFARMLLLVVLLIAGFAVVGYAAGWVTFQHDEQRQQTTIQVDTGDVEQATRAAVEKGKELIEQTVDQLDGLDDDATGHPSPTDASSYGR